MIALTIEQRKRSLLSYLSELENEAILIQIEHLLRPSADFWDELSPDQQATIKKGIQQLDEGKGIDYAAFMEKHRQPSAA